MKTVILLIAALIITSELCAQLRTNWVYVGDTQRYKIYYLKNSVTRGTYTYVTVIGEFRNKEFDPDGKEYKYASAVLAYYKSAYGDIRCILTDKRYYYNDNDYRKANEPKIQYIVSSVKILNDIYNIIK
jgi:hypothetical protein